MKIFKLCGLCNNIILPKFHKTRILEFNGKVHESCAKELDKKSVLYQLKGKNQE